MSEERGDHWDAFGPSTEPEADSPEDPDRPSPLSHPLVPWVVVGVVVVVVIALISMGRSDGDSSDRGRPAADAPDSGGGGDGGDGAEAPKRTCPGYELGTNLFGEPQVASEPGVHVWHDIEGFHLRLVPIPGELEAIRGSVVGESVALSLAEPVPPGVSDEAGVLRFDLDAENPEMLFKRSCGTTAVEFEILNGAEPVPAESVTIGNGAHPPEVPFRLQQLDE